MAPVPIELAVSYEGTTASLTLGGEVDARNSHRLKAVLQAALAMGSTDLRVDVGQVTFMDSSGLAVLAYAARQAGQRDGTATVVGASSIIRRMLAATGIDEVLDLE